MPNVYILTWCKSLESLYGSTLVFQTLRVGFPTAPVYVFDNGSLPEARDAIREAAVGAGAVFTELKNEVPHHAFLNGMINRQKDGAAVFVDPDVCFWSSVESWRFDALFAGRRIPCLRDEATQAIYQDPPAMHKFARQWRDEHRGKWFTTDKLSGLCLIRTPGGSRRSGGRRR